MQWVYCDSPELTPRNFTELFGHPRRLRPTQSHYRLSANCQPGGGHQNDRNIWGPPVVSSSSDRLSPSPVSTGTPRMRPKRFGPLPASTRSCCSLPCCSTPHSSRRRFYRSPSPTGARRARVRVWPRQEVLLLALHSAHPHRGAGVPLIPNSRSRTSWCVTGRHRRPAAVCPVLHVERRTIAS
jgi:hypothetical protein